MLAVSPKTSKRPARVPPFNECPAKILSDWQADGAAEMVSDKDIENKNDIFVLKKKQLSLSFSNLVLMAFSVSP